MLLKRIISEVLIMKTSKKGDELIDKYNEQGWISDDALHANNVSAWHAGNNTRV